MHNFIVTHSGVRFSLADPQHSDVHLMDIAHALSNLCRFIGHTERFYSVAEHSINVSLLVSPPAKIYAMLHDAAEAYIGDLSRPVRRLLAQQSPDAAAVLDETERKILSAVYRRFGLPEPSEEIAREVKAADDNLLYWEVSHGLMKGEADWFGKKPERAFPYEVGYFERYTGSPEVFKMFFAQRLSDQVIEVKRLEQEIELRKQYAK